MEQYWTEEGLIIMGAPDGVLTPEYLEKLVKESVPSIPGVYFLFGHNLDTGVLIIYIGVSWDVRARYIKHLRQVIEAEKGQKVHKLMRKHSIVPEIILLADTTLAGTGIKEVMESLVMCAKQSFVDDVDSHYLHHKVFADAACPGDGLFEDAIGGNAEISIFRAIPDKPSSECEICDIDLGSIAAARKHKTLEHGYADRWCNICERYFPDSTALRRHINCHHLGRRDFPCADEECDKMYSSKADADYHFLRIHKQGFPLACKHVADGCTHPGFCTVNVKRAHEAYECEWSTDEDFKEAERLMCGLGRCPILLPLAPSKIRVHQIRHSVCKECRAILPSPSMGQRQIGVQGDHLAKSHPELSFGHLGDQYTSLDDIFEPAVADAKLFHCFAEDCKTSRGTVSTLRGHLRSHEQCIRGCDHCFPNEFGFTQGKFVFFDERYRNLKTIHPRLQHQLKCPKSTDEDIRRATDLLRILAPLQGASSQAEYLKKFRCSAKNAQVAMQDVFEKFNQANNAPLPGRVLDSHALAWHKAHPITVKTARDVWDQRIERKKQTETQSNEEDSLKRKFVEFEQCQKEAEGGGS